MCATKFLDHLLEGILPRLDRSALPAIERDLARLRALRVDSIEDAIDVAIDSGRPTADRVVATWCLGKAGDQRSKQVLVDLVRSEPLEELSWEAAKAIAANFSPSERPALAAQLVQVLKASPDVARRSAIAFALGLLGEEIGVSPLSDLLLDGAQAPTLREHAAEALGNLRTPAATAALLQALSARSSSIELAIVRALGEVKSPLSLEALKRVAAVAGQLHEEAGSALDRIREQEPPVPD